MATRLVVLNFEKCFKYENFKIEKTMGGLKHVVNISGYILLVV